MKPRKIFISSVQKEFARERTALRDYLHANSLFAEPLYLTKYIERMGTGTLDMIRRCREAGLPEPRFQVTDGFALTIPRPPAATWQTAGPLGERLGERLGETRAAILQAMMDNPRISAKKLAGILDISTTAVEKNIRYLKSQGYLKRTGPAKGGYWEVLQ